MIDDTRRWDSISFVLIGTVLLAIVLLYFPFLITLIKDWETNDNYSHGYFIPAITGYMVFYLRKDLARITLSSTINGLPLIICGLMMLIAAKIGAEFFLQRFSLIIVLLGIVLYLCGMAFFKKLAVPLLYLTFMIPLPEIIWNKISFPMQLFGSYLTEKFVYLIGIPVYREGNVLHLSETTLEVVAACSGLRSLVIMFAMSSLLVWMSQLSTGRKLVLFFAAMPTAIVANIIRLTVTAILASQYGSVVAEGFMHDISGMFTFVIGMALLMLIHRILD